jgi:rubredoxin
LASRKESFIVFSYPAHRKDKRDEKRYEEMKKYVCDICGYVYDPNEGDPDSNIPAGTAFEDLPDDWLCPVCGASKADFTVEE